MYGMIALFVVVFFAGLIFQKEVSVTGASAYSTYRSSAAAVSNSMAASYGDACVFLAGAQTPGFVGQFTNAQVLAASPQPLPAAGFMPGWACEMQTGAPGTSYVVAAFPGVAYGTNGNLMYDSAGDETYWSVLSVSALGASAYSISSAVNLATGQTTTINPPITITSQNITAGTVIRWEIVTN